MARLVIVSNRVSVPSSRRAETGGLTVVLKDGLRRSEGLWFGWSGDLADSPGPAKITTRGKMSYALIDLKPKEYRGYYYGFANGVLWPLFHYRMGLFDWHSEHFQAYRDVNRRFAEQLFPLLKPGDRVWVHDYQLIAVGEELRKLGFTGPIGFYLHIPFPPGEVVEVLPRHRELGKMFLAYDLIGVQTDRDHRALREFLVEWIGARRDGDDLVANGRTIRTGVYRAAIDTQGFAKEAAISGATEDVHRLVQSLGGRKLLFGVERLDYTKGLPLRFAAFEHLLAHHQEWLQRVIMMQIAPVSRGELAQYRSLRSDLEAATGRIAGRFATPDWMPIRYMNQPVQRKLLAGYLRAARVGLVTPLRDGMNLVAKEFVAAQDPEDPGVLVLSRFAGAAEELDGAVLCNPFDVEHTADAMHAALGMPLDERIDRWQRCMVPLNTWTARTWYDQYVATLDEIAANQPSLASAA